MSDIQPSQLPERNPVTHEAHRREVLWQVTVPLIIGIVAILVLAFLAARGATDNVSRWADISLIWLILPMLFITLIFILLVGAIAYGVIWLVRKLPVYARRAQDLVASLVALTRRLGDAVVEPIIRIRSYRAAMEALRRELRGSPRAQAASTSSRRK